MTAPSHAAQQQCEQLVPTELPSWGSNAVKPAGSGALPAGDAVGVSEAAARPGGSPGMLLPGAAAGSRAEARPACIPSVSMPRRNCFETFMNPFLVLLNR